MQLVQCGDRNGKGHYEEGNRKEAHGDESRPKKVDSPRSQAVDEGRCSRFEGTLKGTHASCADFEGDETHSQRVAPPGWYFGYWIR